MKRKIHNSSIWVQIVRLSLDCSWYLYIHYNTTAPKRQFDTERGLCDEICVKKFFKLISVDLQGLVCLAGPVMEMCMFSETLFVHSEIRCTWDPICNLIPSKIDIVIWCHLIKDNSILLLIFYTVVTQQKFDSKSVTQLSSVSPTLLLKIAAKFKFFLCDYCIKN